MSKLAAQLVAAAVYTATITVAPANQQAAVALATTTVHMGQKLNSRQDD